MNQCLCNKNTWYACSCFASVNSNVNLAITKSLTNSQTFELMEYINKDYLELNTEQRSIPNKINENIQKIKRYVNNKIKQDFTTVSQDINLACEENADFEKEMHKKFNVYQLAKERINLVKILLMEKELKYEKVLEAVNIITEVIKRMEEQRCAIENTIFARRSMKIRGTFTGGFEYEDKDNQDFRNSFFSPNARNKVDEQALKNRSKIPFRSFRSGNEFKETDFEERGSETLRKSSFVRHDIPEHFNRNTLLNEQFSRLSLSPKNLKTNIAVYNSYVITVVDKKIVSFNINLNKFEDKIQSDLLFYDRSSFVQAKPGEFFYLENFSDPKTNLNNFYLININTGSIIVHQSPRILKFNVGCLGYCENKVYVFGGCNKSNQPLDDSECFSIDTGTWTSIKSLPIPIAWASIVTQGKLIFICSLSSSRIIVYDTVQNCYYYDTHEKALHLDELNRAYVAFIFGFNDKVICSMGGKLYKGPYLWEQITINPNLEAARLMPRTWTQQGNFTYLTLDNKKIYKFNEETKSLIAFADFSTKKTANDFESPQKK
ncbi:hypothetical protein SteCoe_5360 [Stentor coeruleus]|uniref:Uncharacterized protein n=1 Tax=Stentor coeruleus TaxID=5963 RepID=A0A1R2CSE4_9CILI|nr:hypothetical protein SteCoe_5360 [Stentor coeruleus]